MEDEEGYSPFFYVALLIGFVGLVGFLCTGGALVGGM